MTISSMTGFARMQGQFENYNWVWEIRSVNGKGLDVRMRIPSGLDDIDQHIKNHMKKEISRGSVNVSLQLEKDSNETNVKVNENALEKLIVAAKTASDKHDLPMPSVDSLMMMRDIVEITSDDEDEEILQERNKALKASYADAVTAFKNARMEEGSATKSMLENILSNIESHLNEAEKIAATTPKAIKDKFTAKVDALFDNNQKIDEDRIAQEIVMLATKADVKEETDRLRAHIDAARKLLETKGPVGRKFEFLAQEFNREANTLCSKSSDISLTDVGLSLKTTIDQLREQILNIE